MTTQQWIELITPILVALSLAYQKWQAANVKTALDNAHAKSDTKLDTIHGLVNSSMASQKRITMLQARRIADLTHLPEDEALAADSARTYTAHVASQALADADIRTKAAEVIKAASPQAAGDPLVVTLENRLDRIEGLLKTMLIAPVAAKDIPVVGNTPIATPVEGGKVQP